MNLREHAKAPLPLGHDQPGDDGHGQGVDFASDEEIAGWHEWEHHLTHGSRSHVHDEISARRFHLPVSS